MKKLYTPVTINKLELKNRLVMSPMSIGHTVNGFITDDVVELYKRRAAGGVGLIVFANMQWDKVRFNPNHGALLTDEKFIPMLKKLTDGVHAGGAKIFAQLMNRGRCANRASIGIVSSKSSMARASFSELSLRPYSFSRSMTDMRMRVDLA